MRARSRGNATQTQMGVPSRPSKSFAELNSAAAFAAKSDIAPPRSAAGRPPLQLQVAGWITSQGLKRKRSTRHGQRGFEYCWRKLSDMHARMHALRSLKMNLHRPILRNVQPACLRTTATRSNHLKYTPRHTKCIPVANSCRMHRPRIFPEVCRPNQCSNVLCPAL